MNRKGVFPVGLQRNGFMALLSEMLSFYIKIFVILSAFHIFFLHVFSQPRLCTRGMVTVSALYQGPSSFLGGMM